MKDELISTLLAAVALTTFAPLAQARPHKVGNWERHHHHRICRWMR